MRGSPLSLSQVGDCYVAGMAGQIISTKVPVGPKKVVDNMLIIRESFQNGLHSGWELCGIVGKFAQI